jgi:DNA-binding PadR family transcriptional regulator
MRGIGANQRDVIGHMMLRTRGAWWAGCGWNWGSSSQTVRVLESLVRRGLVTKSERPDASGYWHRYELTEAGRQEGRTRVERGKASVW